MLAMPLRRVPRLDDMPGTGPQCGGAEGGDRHGAVGLPGLFVLAGTLTASADPAETPTPTVLTLHGHVLVDVCAALS
jgi:hypothetical protein